ncbi:hypothetical protein O181_026639 [Austropuccinia psidii MF-1]|uniref:Integrase zinc-binding domain-containing protein n=1 Tax=Austropuccinia psidii MF-1 TaxID=1389203 RepID=A0A9Q3H1T7_9BASI|nr:hypothetical protein [Austropuccinia psidii MF-1]
MEIDRKRNFRLSEWEPGSGTPNSEDTQSEGTETPILGISSSELQNELFSAKSRSPELESQLEEPRLRDYKDNKFFLIDGLLYHREKHSSALAVIDRDHISLILQECHDCPYMGHMNEDRTKERVASTAWRPKWEQEYSKNAVEVRLTEGFSRKNLVFKVSLVKPYFQTGEDNFHFRKKTTTSPEIMQVEDFPGPVKKIIKARKIRLNGKDQRQYLVRFKNQRADKDKCWKRIPYKMGTFI